MTAVDATIIAMVANTTSKAATATRRVASGWSRPFKW